jgi:hypothetical protein
MCQAITIQKAYKHIKEKQYKHNTYVNVGEIFDQRGPYHLKSSVCLGTIKLMHAHLASFSLGY